MLITTKTHTEVSMSYKHITLNDRNKIEVLKQEGYSSRRIAKILGFHHSTISRELKRCNNIYSAVKANKDKDIKSLQKGRKSKATKMVKDTIVNKLNSKWSPEQITSTILKGVVSFKTIYNWLYSATIKFDISKLRRKGKSRKVKETRGKFNIGTSIRKRPSKVKKEWNLVIGNQILQYLLNENSNGLLREYYPKKTDLAKIGLEELIKNMMELNNRPRKCLNYLTPFDVFMSELSLL